MKTVKELQSKFFNSGVRAAWALVCLGLAGCQSPKTVARLVGGYEEVNHPSNSWLQSDADAPPRVSFDYRKPSGQTIVIWPSLSEEMVVFRGNMAVFVGDQAYKSADGKGMRPRLFVVDAPALPVDVTDEILGRWAKAHGKSLEMALQNLTTITPQAKNGQLAVRFEFWASDLSEDNRDWPDAAEVDSDWSHVDELVRVAKDQGVEKKDLRWHSPYIEEKAD